jgi:hypothetical protein
MKRILQHCSRRHGFDGWVVWVQYVEGRDWYPLEWTLSTTREEVREILAGMPRSMFASYRVGKAKLQVLPA